MQIRRHPSLPPLTSTTTTTVLHKPLVYSIRARAQKLFIIVVRHHHHTPWVLFYIIIIIYFRNRYTDYRVKQECTRWTQLACLIFRLERYINCYFTLTNYWPTKYGMKIMLILACLKKTKFQFWFWINNIMYIRST